MGLIRKSLSVGTLGIVSFRSKKERLARAERSQHVAEASLAEEHVARTAAEARVGRAERHARRATAKAARHTNPRRGKGRRDRVSEPLSEVLAEAERVTRRTRKSARRSMSHAKDAAVSAKDAAAPHVEALANRAAEAVKHTTTS